MTRWYWSYTPRNWEFGFGFYRSSIYVNKITNKTEIHPSEIALLLGPFSICMTFGFHIEVIKSN